MPKGPTFGPLGSVPIMGVQVSVQLLLCRNVKVLPVYMPSTTVNLKSGKVSQKMQKTLVFSNGGGYI